MVYTDFTDCVNGMETAMFAAISHLTFWLGLRDNHNYFFSSESHPYGYVYSDEEGGYVEIPIYGLKIDDKSNLFISDGNKWYSVTKYYDVLQMQTIFQIAQELAD